MTCSKCGNQVNEGMFCDQCGTKAGSAATPQSPPAPPPAGAPMPPPPGAPASPPHPPMGSPPPIPPQATQPPYRSYSPPPVYPGDNAVPTVGNFVVVQFLMMIPLVNIILLIIWAVGGSGTPVWKRNYSRAQLIMMLIGIAISIIIIIALSAIFVGLLAEFDDFFDYFSYH